MTTAEIIKRLLRAFAQENNDKFYELAETLIQHEKSKNHHIVAKEFKRALYSENALNGLKQPRKFKTGSPLPRDSENGFPLLEIKEYDISWNDLILSEEKKNLLLQFVEEYEAREILETYGLRPKNKVLFCGKPGTGKTYAARVLSSRIRLPLISIRFDSVISSYLGETATNLRKIFSYIENTIAIVLFDEFDVIGKNRDDHFEHGEIKRVVNNFLQMLDSYEGDSLIIAATNHQHILDPALWRRFDEIVYFPLPDTDNRAKIFEIYLRAIGKRDIDIKILATKTEDLTPSDIKLICIESMKRAILGDRKKIDMTDLEHAIERFLERKKVKESKEYNNE